MHADGSEWRHRIEQEAEHFLDVSAWSVGDIAGKISSDEIQIAINLNGYTKGARNEIFALLPAPVQTSYMGFPATTGGPPLADLSWKHAAEFIAVRCSSGPAELSRHALPCQDQCRCSIVLLCSTIVALQHCPGMHHHSGITALFWGAHLHTCYLCTDHRRAGVCLLGSGPGQKPTFALTPSPVGVELPS